jgi:hypothetical protein
MEQQNLHETHEEMSLTDFLEKNHISLSALGVMIALATFLANLSISWVNYLFSLFMLIGTLAVWWEVRSKIPKRIQFRLKVFKFVFSASYWLLVIYILLRFRGLSYYLLSTGILFTVAPFVLKLLFKIKWFKQKVIYLRQRRWGIVVLFVFAMVLAGILTRAVLFISKYADSILGFISLNFR